MVIIALYTDMRKVENIPESPIEKTEMSVNFVIQKWKRHCKYSRNQAIPVQNMKNITDYGLSTLNLKCLMHNGFERHFV